MPTTSSPPAEAVIRNLEAGRAVLARLNATAPRVAYCPDTFGHPSALPASAQGFGFVTAIVWRGSGGRSHPAVDTAWSGRPRQQPSAAVTSPARWMREFGSALTPPRRTRSRNAGVTWHRPCGREIRPTCRCCSPVPITMPGLPTFRRRLPSCTGCG
ncbi:MAG: hypothetical protein IPP90_20950 [Gemmatimonadaceae bacterium]|nr:hypothetical protein [Gemmatimonadaceae bacterium]